MYNPQESEEIINRLKECPTGKEIKELIDEVFCTLKLILL